MIHPDLDITALRSFASISALGSFSRAAERHLRSQAAITQQIQKLEGQLGAQLFDRSRRQVRLTPAGEKLLQSVLPLLAAHDAMVASFREPDLAGRVRLGTPEDFATSQLSGVLAAFAEAHPQVSLEVSCDLTLNLMAAFQRDAFDLVLVKRDPGEAQDSVWREQLVWVDGPGEAAHHRRPLPLVLSPQPCIYRQRALAALDAAGLGWRLSYVSPSLAGAQAAVRAHLGVTVLPRTMVPEGLAILGPDAGLPPLPDTEIALLRQPGSESAPVLRLAGFITQALTHRH